MINWTLFQPRNFLVIAGIVIAWHILLSPVFATIGSKPSEAE